MTDSNNSYYKAISNAARCLVETRDPQYPNLEEMKTLTFKSGAKNISILLPTLAVSWCIKNHLPAWSPASWRSYRSGYKKLLINALKKKFITQSAYEISIREIDQAKASPKTKQSKSKQTFVAKDLIKIIERANKLTTDSSGLPKNKYKWGAALTCWLQASILTGLSPEEWTTAAVERSGKGKMTLRYKKSKTGANKLAEQYAFLYLSELSHDAMINIESHILLIDAYVEAEKWEKLYRCCACLIGGVNRKIWPRRTLNITLHTAYQKFSQEFVYVNVSEEINALVRALKASCVND